MLDPAEAALLHYYYKIDFPLLLASTSPPHLSDPQFGNELSLLQRWHQQRVTSLKMYPLCPWADPSTSTSVGRPRQTDCAPLAFPNSLNPTNTRF